MADYLSRLGLYRQRLAPAIPILPMIDERYVLGADGKIQFEPHQLPTTDEGSIWNKSFAEISKVVPKPVQKKEAKQFKIESQFSFEVVKSRKK